MLAIRSTIPGIDWPGIPSGDGANLLALQYQFEQSQWWSPSEIRASQWRQLRHLLAHAAQTVPFYQARLRDAGIDPACGVDPDAFARLPLLTRRDIQAHADSLMSQSLPREHGRRIEHKSGGSTGEPVRVIGTDITRLFWLALTLRDHLWHQRDLSGKLCSIRSRVDDGIVPGWGPATDSAFATGPCAILNIRADLARQLEWMQQHAPDYLLSHPSNVRELARLSLRLGVKLPQLREVRCFGETLPQELRTLCRDAWNAKVVDVYSAEEAGYIALQCPQHDQYHVQSENLLVEILESSGQPCAAGQTGRVVITSLHNFAMPLIRYAIGDYAEAGATCACGRGLPVLTRILGRGRNMLVLPDGQHRWPSFPAIRYAGIAPIQQLQVIQRTRETIEIRFVAERTLSDDEQRNVIAAIQESFGYPFAATLTPVAEIPRSASMKHEDFISDIAAAEERGR